MSDQYRYENMTPEQLDILRKSYQDLRMNPLPIQSAETFNSLPLKKRQALFSVLGPLSKQDGLPTYREAAQAAPEVPPAPEARPSGTPPLPPGLVNTIEPGTAGLGVPPILNVNTGERSALTNLVTGPLENRTPPLPDSLEPSTSGIGERAGQFGIGLAEGGLRYGAPMIAATQAFAYALPTAPVTLGAGPVAAGLAAFGITSLVGGKLADQIPAAPEGLEPWRQAGSFTGGFTVGGLSALRSPASAHLLNPGGVIQYPMAPAFVEKLYKIMDLSGQFARANPVLYTTGTFLTGLTGGAASGGAEAYAPGNTAVRLTSEIGATIFQPGMLAMKGLGLARDTLRNQIIPAIRGTNSEAAVQARANTVYKILDNAFNASAPIRQLEELGTPEALAKAQVLRDRYFKNLIRDLERVGPIGPGGAMPTSAQAVKSAPGMVGLSLLEKSLSQINKDFGSSIAEQAKNAMLAQQAVIESLRNIGDPTSLRVAAQMQAQMYDDMLNGRIAQAELDSAAAIAKIGPESSIGARRQAGNVVKTNLDNALGDARNHESRLWDEALRGTMVRRKGELVHRQTVPKATLRTIMDVLANLPEATAKTMLDKNPEFKLMVRQLFSLDDDLKKEVARARQQAAVDGTGGQAEAFGLETALASYRRGMRTEAYLKTGIVPDEYLILGVKPGTGVTRSRYDYKKNKRVEETIPVEYLPLSTRVDLNELYKIRGRLLGMARDAAAGRGQMDPNDARMYGLIASSILDDFSNLKLPAFDKARAFSRSLNDAFTRTYARDVNAVTRAGADRLLPEQVVSQLFTRNRDMTVARMEQIEDAVGFFAKRYDALAEQAALLRRNNGSPYQIRLLRQQMKEIEPLALEARKRVSSVADAQLRMVRMVAMNPTIYNRETGRVNSAALSRWVAANDEVMQYFPTLKDDLNDVVRAESLLATAMDTNSAAARAVRDSQAFSSVLVRGERTSHAVADVLQSDTPAAGLRSLSTLARTAQDPNAASRGLKSAIYEWAYTRAGGTGTKFNVGVFRDSFFKPIADGQPSVAKILTDNGLMTKEEVRNLSRLTTTMRQMQDAAGSRQYIDAVLGGGAAIPLNDFAIRFVALHLGSNVIPSGPGSLAAASAVSETARKLFSQLPKANMLKALQEAAENPKVMAALLRRGRTDSPDYMKAFRDLNIWMRTAGLVYEKGRSTVPIFAGASDERESMQAAPLPEGGPAPPRPRLGREATSPQVLFPGGPQKRPLPPAPPTRGMPMRPPQGGGKPPAGPAGPAAPPTSQSRTMLQQLFPFDAVTGMAGAPPPMQG